LDAPFAGRVAVTLGVASEAATRLVLSVDDVERLLVAVDDRRTRLSNTSKCEDTD